MLSPFITNEEKTSKDIFEMNSVVCAKKTPQVFFSVVMGSKTVQEIQVEICFNSYLNHGNG